MFMCEHRMARLAGDEDDLLVGRLADQGEREQDEGEKQFFHDCWIHAHLAVKRSKRKATIAILP